MRGASNDPQGEPDSGDPESVLGTQQPHYRFHRQPVKYHRHHNPGPRPSSTGRAAKQPSSTTRSHPGSADSSRSSSPEPGARRLSQNFNTPCENTCFPHQANIAAGNKMEVPLSPRDVVQYMLGLDSMKTQGPSQETASGCETDLIIRQSNNTQSRVLCHSPKSLPVEHTLTSPAQKILSGLKLRRSHSGKDEQLFV